MNDALLKGLEEIDAMTAKQTIMNNQRAEFMRACQNIRPNKEGIDQINREGRRLESGLPFYGYRSSVVEAVRRSNVVIIIGETGSGKSTQIAPYLLDAHLSIGESFLGITGKIVVTQPRNLAATKLAARVAEEWGCAQGRTALIDTLQMNSKLQKIAYCTDSKLLGMIRQNPTLEGIDCVVVDEVHERSISTDMLLGCLKGVLRQRRYFCNNGQDNISTLLRRSLSRYP